MAVFLFLVTFSLFWFRIVPSFYSRPKQLCLLGCKWFHEQSLTGTNHKSHRSQKYDVCTKAYRSSKKMNNLLCLSPAWVKVFILNLLGFLRLVLWKNENHMEALIRNTADFCFKLEVDFYWPTQSRFTVGYGFCPTIISICLTVYILWG